MEFRFIKLSHVLLALFCTNCFSTLASSQDKIPGESQTTLPEKPQQEEPLSSWRLFGGIGTGLGTVSGADYSNSPNGTQFSLSGLISYQIPKWVFDAGASWYYSNISGTNTQNLPITIRTRMGMIDLSPRYRIGSRWQVGPVLNLAFGADTGFGPTVGNSIGTYFGGVKGVYEIPYEKFPIRLWSQISTDLNISDRQATIGLIGIQIGIPLHVKKREVESPPQVASVPAVPGGSSPLKIYLDSQKVFFNTNSSKLRPEVAVILQDVGNYLDQNNDLWKAVEINGHADQRGRFQYNLVLSKKRAMSVRKAIVAQNELTDKFKADGFSYLQPLDPKNNKAAWAINRRVELIFHNVQNPAVLIQKLKPLMSQQPGDIIKGES